MKELRPEHQVLICIARKTIDRRTGELLDRLLTGPLDWAFLVQSATVHGLLPLLYSHLNNRTHGTMPPELMDRLKTDFFENNRCNLYLLRELLQLLRLFQENDIKALAFKGPVLGALLWGDVALRRAGDLDILIPKRDFAGAKELLHSSGYRMFPHLTANQEQAHLASHCEIEFCHEAQISVVDLHWALVPKNFTFKLDVSDIFARSRTISLGGQEVHTFSDEDLMLYLAMHGAKHYWIRFDLIASLAELVRQDQTLDWQLLMQRAKKAKAELMLHLGLALVRDLFDQETPLEAERPKGQAFNRLLDDTKANLFAERTLPLGPWEMFRLNLQFMDNKKDAIVSLARSIGTPTLSDWQAIRLPAALYPLYYLIRPVRLLTKHASLDH